MSHSTADKYIKTFRRMFTALDIQNTQYTKIGNTAIDQQVSHVPYNEILCSNKKNYWYHTVGSQAICWAYCMSALVWSSKETKPVADEKSDNWFGRSKGKLGWWKCSTATIYVVATQVIHF